jgi:hypothetical protein
LFAFKIADDCKINGISAFITVFVSESKSDYNFVSEYLHVFNDAMSFTEIVFRDRSWRSFYQKPIKAKLCWFFAFTCKGSSEDLVGDRKKYLSHEILTIKIHHIENIKKPY